MYLPPPLRGLPLSLPSATVASRVGTAESVDGGGSAASAGPATTEMLKVCRCTADSRPRLVGVPAPELAAMLPNPAAVMPAASHQLCTARSPLLALIPPLCLLSSSVSLPPLWRLRDDAEVLLLEPPSEPAARAGPAAVKSSCRIAASSRGSFDQHRVPPLALRLLRVDSPGSARHTAGGTNSAGSPAAFRSAFTRGSSCILGDINNRCNSSDRLWNNRNNMMSIRVVAHPTLSRRHK